MGILDFVSHDLLWPETPKGISLVYTLFRPTSRFSPKLVKGAISHDPHDP